MALPTSFSDERIVPPANLGHALFWAGLTAWAWRSLELVPYWYRGLHYVSSLEWGYWGTSEWVHPAFVPLLGVYRLLLGLLGHTGGMLVPLELLNIAAGTLTLAVLFLAAERAGGDSWTAAAGTLMLAFSNGFWSSTLRPDPYALAAAASVLTLLILGSGVPADGRRRWALAGLAAGLTTGLHAGGLSLAPVAAWAAARGPKPRRALAWFGGAMSSTVLLCYAVFFAYNRISLDYFRRGSFSEAFAGIEQEAGTSIYTSLDPLKQAADFLESLRFIEAGPFLALAALLGIWTWAAKRGTSRSGGPSARAAGLALMNLAAYSLFFIINNTHNKFIYVILLPAPVLLSIAAGGAGPLARLTLTAVAGTCATLGAARGLAGGPSDDPIYSETRFLDGLLRAGDVLVLPGCPKPELLFGRRPAVLPISDLAPAGDRCLAPGTPLSALPGRLRETISRGRRVYFPGEEGVALEGRHRGWSELFTTAGESPEQRTRGVLQAREALEKAFTLDCGLRSPHGRTYCRLRPKPGVRDAQGSPSSTARALTVEELRRRAEAFRPRGGEFVARMRTRYLLDWLADSPEDAYAKSDLLFMLSGATNDPPTDPAAPAGGRRGLPPKGRRQARPPACAQALELAGTSVKANRRESALKALRKAKASCPDDAGAFEDMALLYRSLGDPARALASVERLLRGRPDAPGAHLLRAETLAELGRRVEALEAFGRARALGLSVDGLRRAAWAYQALEECGEALRIWRLLAQKSGASAKDYSDKAVCEYRSGDWESAVSDLRRAMRISPPALEAYASLGAIYSSRGLDAEALEVYDLGLRQGRESSPILRRQLAEGREAVLGRMGRGPRP